MPSAGFKSVTVSNKTAKELKEFAEATHRSIPKAIEYLMDIAKKQNPEEAE